MERKTHKVLGYEVDLLTFDDAVKVILESIKEKKGMQPKEQCERNINGHVILSKYKGIGRKRFKIGQYIIEIMTYPVIKRISDKPTSQVHQHDSYHEHCPQNDCEMQQAHNVFFKI